MKIETLQLHNFRQFYGTTPKLEFSSGEKSTTVIHASNGAGKTAILNAFTWVLFEAFSPGFLLKDQLINKRALRETSAGTKVEAWVQIVFEHEGYDYCIKRTVHAIPTLDAPYPVTGESEVQILRTGRDGVSKPVTNPGSVIGRILPEALHRYFFFDGERIEKMVSPDEKAQADLEKATKIFLGVETLVRAERHLNTTRKSFEDTLKSVGDSETAAFITKKEELESEITEREARIVEHNENIAAENLRQDKLQNSLRELEAAKSLQKRRDQLKRDHETRLKSQEQNIAMLKGEISNRAYTVFLDSASDKFMTLLNGLQKRGELPAGIKINFVDDLLNRNICICGTSLAPENHAARLSVEEWKSRAGLVEVEDKAIRMKGEISQIRNEVAPFWDRIDEIEIKRASDNSELSRIEDELDEISEKLTGSSEQEVSKLELQLSESKNSVRNWERDRTLEVHKVEQCRLEIADIDDKVAKHKSKEARQLLLQRRIAATNESILVIQAIRQILEEKMRNSLQKRIRRIFNQISVTPYVPDLTETYTLRLLESAGGSPAPVAASQGENQLLSFSFIGAIVEEAKEWNQKHKDLPGPNSSEYPIVMDSPFGALDPVYRCSIAEHLNLLADQVILLLTKTQWRGEVETSVQHKIGQQYVVTYHSPRQDIETDFVEINGQKYQTITASSNDFEYSIIQPI
jgi:DNA sulfur modification protein DndD